MSRKLLSILVLLLLIFGIYNFRQGILDNYAARSLGEYVVERLQSMLLPDGKFKDKKLQAEFEVWLKNREAAVS